MAGSSRPCQRYSRGPAKLKDGFRIMFRLLYTASERVAKRAGFCVDSWATATVSQTVTVTATLGHALGRHDYDVRAMTDDGAATKNAIQKQNRGYRNGLL